MTRRTAVEIFSLANNAYRGATVTFYAVDPATLEQLSTLVTLYDAPTGGNVLSNPYTLSSNGRAADELYIEEATVAVINSSVVGQHTTGVILPNVFDYWMGAWESAENYLAGQWVKDGTNGADTGNRYACLVDHESGVWATDLGAGKWELIHDQQSVANAIAAEALCAANAVLTAADVITTAGHVATTTSNASAAAASATEAEAWASTAEDTTVPGGGGEYSAKHYAAKAEDHFNALATYEDNALAVSLALAAAFAP